MPSPVIHLSLLKGSRLMRSPLHRTSQDLVSRAQFVDFFIESANQMTMFGPAMFFAAFCQAAQYVRRRHLDWIKSPDAFRRSRTRGSPASMNANVLYRIRSWEPWKVWRFFDAVVTCRDSRNLMEAPEAAAPVLSGLIAHSLDFSSSARLSHSQYSPLNLVFSHRL